MSAWSATLLSVTCVSLVSVAGLASLSLDERRLRRLSTVLVSFAVGTLLGDTFVHILPDVFSDRPRPVGASLAVLGGILLFFVIEKLLRHGRGHLPDPSNTGATLPELAAINLVGDALHNFIDGALIAASYLAGPTLGMTTTMAVLCHEIPQELGDFGVLVHSGLSTRKALAVNLASASAAIAGSVATLLAGEMIGKAVADLLLPVTAGGFVYIAAADLIPELQRDRGLRGLTLQAGLIGLGIAVMAVLALVE
jgi:zinc and cadmium transporter